MDQGEAITSAMAYQSPKRPTTYQPPSRPILPRLVIPSLDISTTFAVSSLPAQSPVTAIRVDDAAPRTAIWIGPVIRTEYPGGPVFRLSDYVSDIDDESIESWNLQPPRRGFVAEWPAAPVPGAVDSEMTLAELTDQEFQEAWGRNQGGFRRSDTDLARDSVERLGARGWMKEDWEMVSRGRWLSRENLGRRVERRGVGMREVVAEERIGLGEKEREKEKTYRKSKFREMLELDSWEPFVSERQEEVVKEEGATIKRESLTKRMGRKLTKLMS